MVMVIKEIKKAPGQEVDLEITFKLSKLELKVTLVNNKESQIKKRVNHDLREESLNRVRI